MASSSGLAASAYRQTLLSGPGAPRGSQLFDSVFLGDDVAHAGRSTSSASVLAIKKRDSKLFDLLVRHRGLQVGDQRLPIAENGTAAHFGSGHATRDLVDKAQDGDVASTQTESASCDASAEMTCPMLGKYCKRADAYAVPCEEASNPASSSRSAFSSVGKATTLPSPTQTRPPRTRAFACVDLSWMKGRAHLPYRCDDKRLPWRRAACRRRCAGRVGDRGEDAAPPRRRTWRDRAQGRLERIRPRKRPPW